MRRFFSAVVVCTALLAVPAVASAAGHHHSAATTAGCTASGGTVQASGLPTDQVINFFVTDATGKTGWVLGFTWDGTFSVPVSAANGPTTYEFTGATYGANGSKYSVFASCQG